MRRKADEGRGRPGQGRGGLRGRVEAAAIEPYDDRIEVYDNPTVESLTARLEFLNATAAPLEDAAALEAEIAALEELLDSTEADAVAKSEGAVEDAEVAAEEASLGTDDEALREALLDAANENRVAEYGDDYVDDEMMDWAKQLLGVGDAYGKIDEVRESMEDSGQ